MIDVSGNILFASPVSQNPAKWPLRAASDYFVHFFSRTVHFALACF